MRGSRPWMNLSTVEIVAWVVGLIKSPTATSSRLPEVVAMQCSKAVLVVVVGVYVG